MKFEGCLKNMMFALSILIILLLVAGCTINNGYSNSVKTQQPTVVATPFPNQVPLENDAYCEIKEFNLTIISNYTRVPLTEEDLAPYPEFKRYIQDVNNNTHLWRNDGTRSVATFDCNESTAIRFFSLSRKYEEFPNQPVFDYHGHYYKIGYNSYIWHSLTEVPTYSPDTVFK